LEDILEMEVITSRGSEVVQLVVAYSPLSLSDIVKMIYGAYLTLFVGRKVIIEKQNGDIFPPEERFHPKRYFIQISF
jgi:hypothetical protein